MCWGEGEIVVSYLILKYTVEPPIKDTPIRDTIEITSEQRTRFYVQNGDFPIVIIYSFLNLR